jgi:hypothetical protein
MQGILVSSVAKKIQALMPHTRRYPLIKATDDVFEIFSTETLHDYIVTVNARTQRCTSVRSRPGLMSDRPLTGANRIYVEPRQSASVPGIGVDKNRNRCEIASDRAGTDIIG